MNNGMNGRESDGHKNEGEALCALKDDMNETIKKSNASGT